MKFWGRGEVEDHEQSRESVRSHKEELVSERKVGVRDSKQEADTGTGTSPGCGTCLPRTANGGVWPS